VDAVEGSALSVAVRVTNTCVSGMCSVPEQVFVGLLFVDANTLKHENPRGTLQSG